MSPPNDGGPAFPKPDFVSTLEGDTVAVFENKPTHGMSLRDWFAGQALIGLLSAYGHHAIVDGKGLAISSTIAPCAFTLADAMLAARAKKGEE